jgi:hypothetical protein
MMTERNKNMLLLSDASPEGNGAGGADFVNGQDEHHNHRLARLVGYMGHDVRWTSSA